jgi:hypothetical protein
MAQTGYRWVVLEGALFNGDEPEHPSSWPNLSRFGDSWSLRGLVHPTPWMEVQVSRAHVHSPEHRGGAGLDQEKWSTSVRAEGNLGTRPAYGLLEWARTDEASGAFRFESLLGEGAIGLGPVRPYMRIERTERPEEERVSPFHSRRPVIEDGLVGISRWTSVTAGVSVELLPASRWSVAPVLESTIGHIEKVGGGIFEVTSWYERPTFWSLSIGVRAGLGMKGHRMGRYGLLRAQEGHGHR